MEPEESLEESESYILAAECVLSKGDNSKKHNVAITNCIMSMIKTIDAAMLKYYGGLKTEGRGHEKTANRLQKLYEEGYLPHKFKSNIDSVRNWVVDQKTYIQYKGKKVSKADADRCLKATRRLYKKMKDELID